MDRRFKITLEPSKFSSIDERLLGLSKANLPKLNSANYTKFINFYLISREIFARFFGSSAISDFHSFFNPSESCPLHVFSLSKRPSRFFSLKPRLTQGRLNAADWKFLIVKQILEDRTAWFLSSQIIRISLKQSKKCFNYSKPFPFSRLLRFREISEHSGWDRISMLQIRRGNKWQNRRFRIHQLCSWPFGARSGASPKMLHI